MIGVAYGGPLGPWASTAHLDVDFGDLYLSATEDDQERPLAPRRRLGPIGHVGVPEGLEGELEALLAAWGDAPSRQDLERELREEYGATRGF